MIDGRSINVNLASLRAGASAFSNAPLPYGAVGGMDHMPKQGHPPHMMMPMGGVDPMSQQSLPYGVMPMPQNPQMSMGMTSGHPQPGLPPSQPTGYVPAQFAPQGAREPHRY